MLFLNTVKSETYELLKKLMQIPELSEFVLVGGTNLSLKFGHRIEAMANRGVKKDFWDINELLNHYSLPEMIEFYQAKYPNSDIGHVLLSMTYFVDAEQQKDNPEDLKGATWEQVKLNMRNTIDNYVKQRLNN